MNVGMTIKRNIITIADIEQAVTYMSGQIQNTICREVPSITINRLVISVTDENHPIEKDVADVANINVIVTIIMRSDS